MRRIAAVACCLLLSASCVAGVQIGQPPGMPACRELDGQVSDVLVLVAQSVPTARWVPCVRTLPVGWTFNHLDARSGRTVVELAAADQDGDHKVTVTLAAACDMSGARQMASERGLRRYERVTRAAPGYLADRYNLFDGGCVTYHFDLRGRAGASAADAVAAGFDLVSREVVAALVSQRSGGRLTLDGGGAT